MTTTVTAEAAYEIIEIAHSNLSSNTRALLALQDAYACRRRGLYEHAARKAITSLSYSRGVFHPATVEAKRLAGW